MTAHEAREAAGAFELGAVPPFDLMMTVSALRRRPTNLVERLVDGEYQRLLSLDGRLRLLGVRQIAPDAVRVLALDGPLSEEERAEAATILNRMLGLSVDLSPAQERITSDPRLRHLAEGLAGLKPPCFPDLWTTLLNVIPYQQVSLDAGMSVANRLTILLGEGCDVAGARVLIYPTPERVLAASPEEVRGCGFSAAKVRTLRAVAQAACDGLLIEAEFAALDDAAALARLQSLPGIGPWSAQLVLLRGMRRLTFFPPGDSGAARNVRLFLGIEDPAEAQRALDELSAVLGPYRGLLYFLLLGQRLRARGELPSG